MNVAVFGAGYVGSVSAACLADQGHSVILVDVDEDKIEAIRAGRAPIAEAGLDQLIAQNVSNGRIRATQSSTEALAATDLCFICVGTPSDANGDVDLRYVRSVCDEIGQYLKGINRFYSVVIRSTMLPESMYGTVIPTLERASEMKAGEGFGIAIYPEFLRESFRDRRLFQSSHHDARRQRRHHSWSSARVERTIARRRGSDRYKNS